MKKQIQIGRPTTKPAHTERIIHYARIEVLTADMDRNSGHISGHRHSNLLLLDLPRGDFG